MEGCAPFRSGGRRPDHLLVPIRGGGRDRLVGFDKKAIGDAFYASAAVRGETMVDAWLRQKGNPDERGS
jgi:hypothetical protein